MPPIMDNFIFTRLCSYQRWPWLHMYAAALLVKQMQLNTPLKDVKWATKYGRVAAALHTAALLRRLHHDRKPPKAWQSADVSIIYISKDFSQTSEYASAGAPFTCNLLSKSERIYYILEQTVRECACKLLRAAHLDTGNSSLGKAKTSHRRCA